MRLQKWLCGVYVCEISSLNDVMNGFLLSVFLYVNELIVHLSELICFSNDDESICLSNESICFLNESICFLNDVELISHLNKIQPHSNDDQKESIHHSPRFLLEYHLVDSTYESSSLLSHLRDLRQKLTTFGKL